MEQVVSGADTALDLAADLPVDLLADSAVDLAGAIVISTGAGVVAMLGTPRAITAMRLRCTITIITPAQRRALTIRPRLWFTVRLRQWFTIYHRLRQRLKVHSSRLLTDLIHCQK